MLKSKEALTNYRPRRITNNIMSVSKRMDGWADGWMDDSPAHGHMDRCLVGWITVDLAEWMDALYRHFLVCLPDACK